MAIRRGQRAHRWLHPHPGEIEVGVHRLRGQRNEINALWNIFCLEPVTSYASETLYLTKRTGFAIFGGGWLPRPDFFVYADEACVTVHPYLFSPGVYEYDPDPVCHQERLSQQASQYPDRAQHRRLTFAAHLPHHHLAQLL